MADLRRAYRRWLLRKLTALVPALAGAAALSIRQTLVLAGGSPTPWIDVACLGAAVTLGAVCAMLAGRSLRCYARRSRNLRRELEVSGPVGIVCLSLVALVAVLPSCFPPMEPVGEVSARTLEAVPEPELRAEGGATAEAAPKSVPTKSAPSAPKLTVETSAGIFFDLQQEDELDLWKLERPQKVGRLGVPDPDKPFDWMRPELHFEVLLLDPSGTMVTSDGSSVDLESDLDMRGIGARLQYDLPTSRDGGLRFQYQIFGLTTADDLARAADPDTEDPLVWQRFSLAYMWRIEGYTSDAEFDLSLFVGLMGDSLLTAAHGGVASEVIRLSPYLGFEAAFWQNGPAGLIFRFGQTIPANFTGAEARVTDFTVLFRVDLSEGFSMHLGYAAYMGRFRDYAKRASRHGEQDELDLILHGPTVGLDVRF